MYWILLVIVIGALAYYLFLKKQGNLDFWKLVAKFPDDAYDFFEGEECWVTFIEQSEGGYQNALPPGDWDGPFRAAVPKISRVINVFGRVPDYHDSQKIFMRKFSGK